MTRKRTLDSKTVWTIWIPLFSNIVISMASAILDLSKSVFFILLGLWVLLFLSSIFISEIYHRKQEKIATEEDDIAEMLQKVIRNAIEDKNLPLTRRSFKEHKEYSGAQESHLQKGDLARIMTNSLSYDLDDSSIDMITKNIANGVSYEYLLERTERNIADMKKLHFFVGVKIAQISPLEASNWHPRFRVYLHTKNKFLHSFVLMDRVSQSNTDHVDFYFNKNEKDENYLYEFLFDDRVEDIEILCDAYQRLKDISKRLI